MNSDKIVVVTGSSSGIGYETSLLLARNGFTTYATMRNLSKSMKLQDIAQQENLKLKILQLDVTNDTSVKDAIDQIFKEQNRIDILINNAGYDIMGSVEDLSISDFKDQFETNFFGIVRIVKEVLKIMRNQREGKIINISSIGGRVGIPLNSAYISSKFALEGFSETIRYELQDFGIDVLLIEPGLVKTNFFENAKLGQNVMNSNSNYKDFMQKLFEGFLPLLNDPKNYSTPFDVAKVILDCILSNKTHFRYLVGEDANSIMNFRLNHSDLELESWIKESLFEKKGFIR